MMLGMVCLPILILLLSTGSRPLPSMSRHDCNLSRIISPNTHGLAYLDVAPLFLNLPVLSMNLACSSQKPFTHLEVMLI